ncbi:MAG: hypothetical protein RR075_06635, partial [Pygmaiobacter sp.]
GVTDIFKGLCKTALKLLCLVPILILMVCVNFYVDYSGFFQGGQFERELVAKLHEGKAISNFQKLDERQILRLYIQNMPAAYDTLVVGSSRGLQIDAAIAGATGTFYNAGMTGEDYYDLVGTVGLLDRYDRLPTNLVLVLDPWILSSDIDSRSKRSDVNLANRFLNMTLGFDVPYSEESNKLYTEALVAPDYFQTNIAYYFSDHSQDDRPSEVKGNLYRQSTEIKLSDGTLLYTKDFRDNTPQSAENDALFRATMSFMMCANYPQPDRELCDQFTAMVDYLRQKGVRLTFVLTPFHPVLYAHVGTHMDTEGGVIYSEEFFCKLAGERNIPFYGSYDAAKANCDKRDFYDGVHVRRESIHKFFFGIDTSLV